MDQFFAVDLKTIPESCVVWKQGQQANVVDFLQLLTNEHRRKQTSKQQAMKKS